MDQLVNAAIATPERSDQSATPFGSEVWPKTPTPAPQMAPQSTPQRIASPHDYHQNSVVESTNDSSRPKRPKGTKSVYLDEREQETLIQFCLSNQNTYGLPRKTTEWWKHIEVQFNGFLEEGKNITNTRRRVETLVHKRRSFLAKLGTGTEDNKSTLNDALDRWIIILDTYDTETQTKKRTKEESELEDKEAVDRRNTMTVVLSKRLRANDRDSSTSSENDSEFNTPKEVNNDEASRSRLIQLQASEMRSPSVDSTSGGTSRASSRSAQARKLVTKGKKARLQDDVRDQKMDDFLDVGMALVKSMKPANEQPPSDSNPVMMARLDELGTKLQNEMRGMIESKFGEILEAIRAQKIGDKGGEAGSEK